MMTRNSSYSRGICSVHLAMRLTDPIRYCMLTSSLFMPMEYSSWWILVDAQFVISISTMVYYTWILILMCNSTSTVFRSAFYRIFIVTGFFDVQAITAIEWIRADLRLALGPDYEIVTRLMNTFTFSHLFIHVIGNFLMTLNRYMAICHPTSYEKLQWWTPRTVQVMLVVDVSLSFFVNAELFFIPFGYQWKDNKWITTGRLKPIPFIRMMCSCIVIIYEFTSIALIAPTIHSIRKSRKKKKTESFRRELGLVVAIAIESLLGGIECIYEITNIFGLESKLLRNTPSLTAKHVSQSLTI
ncbi:hypothetical protein ANCCEY_06561 [Ancylostoma ceylanicum]|uniref:Serpentine receptor class gamma n=1 Tax=Ancylostoma ceylanicum TaxID=53326 RepID=A0A0D6LQN2_9BILA|nr:hypothetical protein ANCCEY_06561 [Ancylostoma ceylanicum]